jgi:hypothetical protein
LADGKLIRSSIAKFSAISCRIVARRPVIIESLRIIAAAPEDEQKPKMWRNCQSHRALAAQRGRGSRGDRRGATRTAASSPLIGADSAGGAEPHRESIEAMADVRRIGTCGSPSWKDDKASHVVRDSGVGTTRADGQSPRGVLTTNNGTE